MHRVAGLLVSLALVLSVLPAAALAVPPTDAGQTYIVVFNESVERPSAAAADLAREHGLALTFVYEHALKGFAASVPAGRVDAVARDPRVAYVEADQVARISGQTVPTGVQRIFADENAKIGIDGTDDYRVDVDVAVIDTGIDLDHPDLYVVDSVNCSGGSPLFGSCEDGGDDDNGHGTHVAGTVAAIDDGVGVVGVAPGARLHAVKVLRADGSGYMSWIVAGIDWVTAQASIIEIANMSLGCECSSAAMDDAIAKSVDAGVAYAVAAGNSDADASTFSPADHPDVLTVSALADFDGQPGALGTPGCRDDEDDTLASFSNFGASVEIAAPGVCILSSVPGGGYDTYSGTSMASPHAAGALGLVASGPGDPKNQTDVEALYDKLINNGNSNWKDDSGDGIQEPLLDVSNTTVFAPTLIAGGGGTGGGGGDGGTVEGEFSLSLSSDSTSQGRNWTAFVTITALDSAGAPVSDIAVTGDWSTGASDGCTTDSSGSCTVDESGIPKKSTSTVTFDVSGATDTVAEPLLTYDGGPDSITVSKP